VLPDLVARWDPDRAPFAGFVDANGYFTVRDALLRDLTATDPAFSVHWPTRTLEWPRTGGPLLTEHAIPDDFDDWNSQPPADVADVISHSRRGGADTLLRFGDLGADAIGTDLPKPKHHTAKPAMSRELRERLALIGVSDLAGAELPPDAIAQILGPVDFQLVQLAAQGWTDTEIGDVLELDRSTVRRHRLAAIARVGRAAWHAMDARLAPPEDVAEPEDVREPEDVGDDDDAILARLARMLFIQRNGFAAPRSSTSQIEDGIM